MKEKNRVDYKIFIAVTILIVGCSLCLMLKKEEKPEKNIMIVAYRVCENKVHSNTEVTNLTPNIKAIALPNKLVIEQGYYIVENSVFEYHQGLNRTFCNSPGGG